MDGKLCHIPCITGQSFVYHALEWDCNLQDLMGVPDDLSEEVRKKCSADDGVLYGTGDQNWYRWHVLEGSWFNTVNLEVPESCGFFPRNDVCRYLSNPEDHELNSEEMLSIEDYQALEPEVKKATIVSMELTFHTSSSWKTRLLRLMAYAKGIRLQTICASRDF